MKTVAIIGATASGKSDLAHELAYKTDAVLLSADSLAVYKYADISSAKPSISERKDFRYFGLDIVLPDQTFGVYEFVNEYIKARDFCIANSKNLIIVGGSGFYVKSLISGLSTIPLISADQLNEIRTICDKPQLAYDLLLSKDKEFAQNIDPNDKYRIEKALVIIYGSGTTATEWYAQNPPKPVADHIKIFELFVPQEILRDRIGLRTQNMIKNGLIDESAFLEKEFGRDSQVFRSIGLKETLEFFDGKLKIDELETQIATHTAQFAKRQITFNKTQFDSVIRADSKIIIDQTQGYLI